MASIQSSTDPRIAQPAMSLRDRLAGYMSGITSQLPASMQSYPDIPQMGVKQGTLAKDLMTPVENAPVVGQALSAEDLGQAAHNKDWWAMGLAALGLMPGGGAEKHAAKEAVEAGRDTLARIKAFHGSPHDFDKFDISKIGTGEGAQAYGHGLYFAENEGVARSYKETLAGKQKWNELGYSVDELLPMMGATTPELQNAMRPYVTRDLDRMIDFLDEEGGGIEAARAIVAKKGYASGAGTVTYPQEMQEAIAQKLAAAHAAKQGHMYEVDINADPEHFLDWDKPLSEHPEHIRNAIVSAAQGVDPRGPLAKSINQNLRSGNVALGIDQAYTGLGGFGKEGQAAATEALSKAGIPGIKYLDQGSRGAGEGSRNYVVFNDKLISIVKKNGIAAALAAGLITESQAAEMRQQGYDE